MLIAAFRQRLRVSLLCWKGEAITVSIIQVCNWGLAVCIRMLTHGGSAHCCLPAAQGALPTPRVLTSFKFRHDRSTPVHPLGRFCALRRRNRPGGARWSLVPARGCHGRPLCPEH